MTAPDALAAALAGLVPAHLTRQRWYSGPDDLSPDQVEVAAVRELHTAGSAHLHQALVDVAGARYQLLLGERPAGEPAEFLAGHDSAVLGGLESSYLYDATVDPDLALALLPIVTAGAETAALVRPVTAEQSNTSLVYDDRIILKVFRRLHEGLNPDVEVTTALAGVGFEHVARPAGRWRESETDLAFAQQFLAGGSEGWALALTSLRDFYDSPVEDPAEAGGDFSSEANRLGRVTAGMHAALGEAFGVSAAWTAEWSWLLDDVARRLEAFAAGFAAGAGGTGAAGSAGRAGGVSTGAGGVSTGSAGGALDVGAAMAQLRGVTYPGPSIRVHGDYHLGQVMRADGGWYVLDFEGEPARPLHERTRHASPLKDVAGMLRSLDYAARFALVARGGAADDPDPEAAAWVDHNRAAFVAGYLAEPAAGRLLPAGADWDGVLAAYELDKALYELDYEAAYRPAWRPIPEAATVRIVRRLGG